MKLNEVKIGKLNVLDLGIILIVLAFVGVFVSQKIEASEVNSVEAGNTNVSSQFTYTILVEGLSDTSSEMIKVGDDVYDRISNTYIGKIKELEITPAQGLLEKTNGEMIRSTVPGKIDIRMKVETEGTIRNGEYLANGLIRIMVGNLKEIKTKYLMCSGTIVEME